MLLNKYKKWGQVVILSLLPWLAMAQVANKTEDPYETYNRSAYRFNKTMDQILLKPAATIYDKSLPAPVKKGVTHFFANLGEIPIVANNLLQANPGYAMANTWRFLLNSSLGVFGLFDVASAMGIPRNYTDFGITLRKWGLKSTPYLVLPLLGPSTFADTLAIPVNLQFTVYPYIDTSLAYGSFGLEMVAKRAEYLKYGSSADIVLDPYIFQRNAYLQQRAELLQKVRTKAMTDLAAGYDFAD